MKLGAMEVVVILVIALLIFGPSKLPELGKAVGETFNQFKTHANKKIIDEDEGNGEDKE